MLRKILGYIIFIPLTYFKISKSKNIDVKKAVIQMIY